jgi:two-component system response regulator
VRRAPLVLLVEDNPTDVFVMKDVLREYGLDLELRVAEDGDHALRYLEELERTENLQCPALVLLDLNLPKVSGVEVLRRLRGASRCRNVPVVVVSSSIADSDQASTRELNVQAYFEKPSDLNAYANLARIIKEALQAE